MSIQSLSRFSEVVDRDPGLRDELGAIRDPKELMRRAVELGAARGFTFSAEELEERLRAVQAAEGELSDEQLGAVSGGATMAEYGLLLALIAVVCIDARR